MSGNTLRIRKWDPSTIKDDRIIMFIGPRGTGKSVMQMDIMKHMANRVDFGVGMTPTMDTIREWQEHMPASWIYDHFDQDKLEDLVNVQRRMLRDGKTPKHLFILLDDTLYDKKCLKSVAMRDVFLNGRHLHLHMSCAVQYLMDLPPDLRTNIDYVICMTDKILANKIKLHKYFFGMFEKLSDFIKVFDKCTANHSAIVLDNTSRSGQISDCVFWYRAELSHGPFRMGAPAFWRLSERHSKSVEEREREARYRDEQARESELSRRRKGPLMISVQAESGEWVASTASTGASGS